MTANDVNVVIDNIASKLGLAARGMADFVPELARYSIVRDIITAVISAVVISVAILAVRWSVKNPPKAALIGIHHRHLHAGLVRLAALLH